MYRCETCGQTFYEIPLEHGNFYVGRDGLCQVKCHGKIVVMTDTSGAMY